ncbi:MAG: DUF2937 family protein [Pseudomonadota bacterium]
MSRFLAFLLGLIGAVGASQAPGYTQQYLQNLTGRVDELRMIVERFDDQMAMINLTRRDGLKQCSATGDTVALALCDGINEDVVRYENLDGQLRALNAASDWERPVLLARNFDRQIAESAYDAYEPAVPVSLAGGAFALAGFALFWGVGAFIFGLIGSIFGRGY